ncbi:MAG: hypothetical protein AB1646_01370 [Thermodesulfobacteriota bacterium]
MDGLSNMFAPALRPQQVSSFLEIKGSELPRLTGQTIGQPTEPPTRRGSAGKYSCLDALLMRLGQMLLGMGLLPNRTQKCLLEIRDWFTELVHDPAFGTEEDRIVLMKGLFLVARQNAREFSVERVDADQLAGALVGPESYRPQTVVNIDKFIGHEFARLIRVMDEQDPT